MSEQLIPTPGTFGENGNFLLERELGSGGMGGVYMGRDKMLDRPVAVKVMLKEYGADAEFVERFKKEAQACARLIHPNIAQVYSYGISDGMPYMAMELAQGGSLWSIMQQNKGHTDVTRVLKICQQVAQALRCASDQGFVHGDIKPENILLDANGNAKIVDFGLAAMQKQTDEIWGTPYYISPEKVKKEPISFRADMYSLGGTLYHALTGVAPFEGDDAIAVVKKRFEGAPKKPSEIRADLSPQIDALVMRMLELDPEKRYPSFEALIDEFNKVLTSGLSADEAKKGDAASAAPAAAKPATKTMTGGRRMMTTRRRMTAMKKPTTVKPATEDEDFPSTSDEDEEEEGGNLGKKVLIFVLGGLLLIGGVVGFLFWYLAHDAATRESDRVQQITTKIADAHKAIDQTRQSAIHLADQNDEFAELAVAAARKQTETMKRLLPDFAELMNVPPTKELLDAIAATNPPPVAVAAPAPVATTNAPAAGAAPTNAPAAAPAAAPAPAATAAAPAADAPAEPPKEVPSAVNDLVNDIWGRAYSCKASAVRIRHGVRQVLAVCDEADQITGDTEQDLDRLSALTRKTKEMFDELSSSKDVENIVKGKSFIESKGQKIIRQTEEKLRIEKLEADRKAQKEAEEAAEAARIKARQEAHDAKVAEEKQKIIDKFETKYVQDAIRRLEWDNALKMLEETRKNFETPEGRIASKAQLQKVTDMSLVQQILLVNLKGYRFHRGKKDSSSIRDYTVSEVSEKDILLLGPDKKSTKRISWSRFYRDYYDNLTEVIIKFIAKGKGVYKVDEKGTSMGLKKWSEAMIGSALTLKIICTNDAQADARAEAILKEAVKQFPDCQKSVKEIFPDLQIEAAATEE